MRAPSRVTLGPHATQTLHPLPETQEWDEDDDNNTPMDADSDDMTASTMTGNSDAGRQCGKMPISGDGKSSGDSCLGDGKSCGVSCRHAGFQFDPRVLQTPPRCGYPPRAATYSQSDVPHSSDATPTHTPTHTPTGGKYQVRRTNVQPPASTYSMEGSLMESRVTRVEDDIRTLSSDVNNLRSDLGTVKHSVNRPESRQSQGNALMVCMLQGIGWSEDRIRNSMSQLGMPPPTKALPPHPPNLAGPIMDGPPSNIPAPGMTTLSGSQAQTLGARPQAATDPHMEVDEQQAQPCDNKDNASMEGMARDIPRYNASRLPDQSQDHVSGLLATRTSIPPSRPYDSSQETSRGDSPPSQQTSEYIDSEDEEQEEEQDADARSPRSERDITPQDARLQKRDREIIKIDPEGIDAHLPVIRKMHGRALHSFHRPDLVEVLAHLDPALPPKSMYAPLIAQISHRLFSGCFIVVQRPCVRDDGTPMQSEAWTTAMARGSDIDNVGQALWECDMPPMKFPPTTKGDYSLSAQGAFELPKGHTFLYLDDAQAMADKLNPPFKRRCRSRRSVHLDAGFS